jgi:hypothetical protein
VGLVGLTPSSLAGGFSESLEVGLTPSSLAGGFSESLEIELIPLDSYTEVLDQPVEILGGALSESIDQPAKQKAASVFGEIFDQPVENLGGALSEPIDQPAEQKVISVFSEIFDVDVELKSAVGYGEIFDQPIEILGGAFSEAIDQPAERKATSIYSEILDALVDSHVGNTDTLTFDDVAIGNKDSSPPATDTLSFNDVASVQKDGEGLVDESLTFSDVALGNKDVDRSIVESLTFSDSASAEKVIDVSATESLIFADETFSLSDGVELVSFNDTADVTRTRQGNVNESIAFNDVADAFQTSRGFGFDDLIFNDLAEVEFISGGGGELIESIIVTGSGNHSLNNTDIQGGGPDPTRRLMTGSIITLSRITLVSSEPTDIDQVYRIEGIDGDRALVSELLQLSGTNAVSTIRRFSRLCKVTKLSGNTLAGDVTVSAGPAILGIMNNTPVTAPVIALNIGTAPAPDVVETLELVNLLGNAQGRATVDTVYYEKIFIRNNTGKTINRAVITEHQSDFEGCVLFAADPCFDFDSTSRNRLTRPGAIDIADIINDDPVVVTDWPNQATLGIWLRIIIPAGMSTILKSWKMKIDFDGMSEIFTILQPDGAGRGLATTLGIRNQHAAGGGNPVRYTELRGAKFVEQLYYEPDPITFRDQFYYNVRLNQLFKKIKTVPAPVWKVVR